MTDPDHDIEQALAALRPRAVSPALTTRLARVLAAPVVRRGVIIAWSSGCAAVAAALIAAFVFWGDHREVESPTYQLVQVEQSRPDVQLFRPVQLVDGSYVRPVRVRWQDTTRREATRGHVRLIHYRPTDQRALLSIEAN